MNVVVPWAMFGAGVLALALYAYRPWGKKTKAKQDRNVNPRKAA
jgi:hypothetical protein